MIDECCESPVPAGLRIEKASLCAKSNAEKVASTLLRKIYARRCSLLVNSRISSHKRQISVYWEFQGYGVRAKKSQSPNYCSQYSPYFILSIGELCQTAAALVAQPTTS